MSTYLYRCTEDKMEQHLQHIAEAGDTVEHVIYKGGRDYVIVCSKARSRVEVVLAQESIDAIAKAMLKVSAKHAATVMAETARGMARGHR